MRGRTVNQPLRLTQCRPFLLQSPTEPMSSLVLCASVFIRHLGICLADGRDGCSRAWVWTTLDPCLKSSQISYNLHLYVLYVRLYVDTKFGGSFSTLPPSLKS